MVGGGGWRVAGKVKRQKLKGKRVVSEVFHEFEFVGELTRHGEPR